MSEKPMTEKNGVEEAKTTYWKVKYDEAYDESAKLREEVERLKKKAWIFLCSL